MVSVQIIKLPGQRSQYVTPPNEEKNSPNPEGETMSRMFYVLNAKAG